MSKIKKYCEGLDCAICDEKEPCIYKIANELEEKLLRKEQEYEELKESIEENSYRYAELDADYDQLKAENDNLKSLIWWIHVGAEGADKATTEYYENRNTPYEENYWKRIRALQPPTYESKYKLALNEIKEIASHYNDMSGNCVIVNFFEDMCKILQKISECEVNNER